MNRSEFSVRPEPVDLAEMAREASRATRRRRASSGSSSRAAGVRVLGRGRPRPAAPGRVEPRRERAARDAGRRPGHRHGRARDGCSSRTPAPASRRRRRRTRSSASTSTTRSAATARSAAASGSRSSSSSRRRWAATFASRAARPGRRSPSSLRPQLRGVDHLEVGAGQLPSACSWSFDQCGLGAPDTYQFEPLSARISPYVFIACATIRACGGSLRDVDARLQPHAQPHRRQRRIVRVARVVARRIDVRASASARR